MILIDSEGYFAIKFNFHSIATILEYCEQILPLMIKIEIAKEDKVEVLSLLARLTYVESHGRFIEDKKDLSKYTDEYLTVAKTKQDVADPNVLFYIIYSDDLPVGYAKLVLNTSHSSVVSNNNCRLERIYILSDFIPLKLGQKLLDFVEKQAKEMKLDTMWLSVYIENERAIRFYIKNKFINSGTINFLINGKGYENFVFVKSI